MAYEFTFTPRFQKHFKGLTAQEKKQLKNKLELPHTLLPPLSLEQEQSCPFELSFHGLHLKIAGHAQLSQLAGILKILQASC